MTCPNGLILSMHADGALSAEEAASIAEHLHGCSRCTAAVARFEREAAELRQVLQTADLEVPIPRLAPRLGVRATLAAAAAAVGAAVLVGGVWSAAAAAVPAPLRWLNPLEPTVLLELSSGVFFYFTREGSAMIASMTRLAAGAVLLGLAGFMLVTLLRRRPAGTAALLSLLLAAAVLPPRADAVEIRRGEGLMTVAAGETIDDTLMIFGESISIDGNVTGDLIAFGRRVSVRGDVGGDVITGAELVTVEGAVAGNVIGFARDLTLTGARVAGNLYGFGNTVLVGTGAEVGGNAATFGNRVAMHGRVGTDLLSFAQELELRGAVDRNVETFGENVNVLPQAAIGGDLISRVPHEENLRRAPGASVGGAVDTRTEPRDEQNPYLTASFYVGKALWLGAAFAAGLLLLWLVPGLRVQELTPLARSLRAGGLGLVTVIVLPVVSVILLVTIIGIPLGIVGILAWLLWLYFAKIVVAQQIGRRLFDSPHGLPHYAATLIAGLVIVLIAINLPFVGGLVNAVLTLVGVGLIAGYLLGWIRPTPEDQSSMA